MTDDVYKTVYVCLASTGEYSDRVEFTLHGYWTEQAAKDFVARSDQLFRKRWEKVIHAEDEFRERHRQFGAGWNPECLDLGEPDYTGYRFWYTPVEVKK